MDTVEMNGVDDGRLDVQELLVHVVPLMGKPYTLHTWNTMLSVGCGVAERNCNILSDTSAEILGTLRDYPPIRVHILLECGDGARYSAVRLTLS